MWGTPVRAFHLQTGLALWHPNLHPEWLLMRLPFLPSLHCITAGSIAEKPTVHVVGMLQQNEQPSAVIPDNKPESLEFHWIDVPNLVRHRASPRLPFCRLSFFGLRPHPAAKLMVQLTSV